ncbi:MAG TPA: peptide-methionine (S)-S-oxide reductase MsrA [Verrucomicrobiae bacterium]|nr:peptide-methionine (S)-S-oxide reductase MsrA [Verrucomicrobiae bacterium]
MGAALAAILAGPVQAAESTATFAGGCFWCTESDFEKVPGVTSAVSGYIGGRNANPTYEEVSAGSTGHAEAVEIRFDPAKVTYTQLLDVYWHSVDPTVKDKQFCDTGSQYRTAIYTHDAEQKKLAETTRAAVEKQLGVKVHTEIVEAAKFYPAEEYHQDYYKKNPVRYRFYRNGCGRDARLEQVWGKKK